MSTDIMILIIFDFASGRVEGIAGNGDRGHIAYFIDRRTKSLANPLEKKLSNLARQPEPDRAMQAGRNPIFFKKGGS